MSECVTTVSLADASASVSSLNSIFTCRSFGPSRSECDKDVQSVDPYSEGYTAGQNAVEQRFADEREALRQLVASAQASVAGHSEELAGMIASTIEHLVTLIVGSAPIDRTHLQTKIADAIELMDEAATAQTLWLHPDDLVLLNDFRFGVELGADATLERGALRLDCSSGWIEESRSIHLDALRAMLGVADTQ